MAIVKQLSYVKDNYDALNKKYDGSYVVISEDLEESAFCSLDDAYLYGASHYGLGNFLLQKFSNGESQVHIINQTIICA